MLRLVRAASAVALCIGLGACQTDGIGAVGSLTKGECQLVHSPEYAVRGKTGYDQSWVDKTTESIVAGCRQRRPKARPASFDAPKVAPTPKTVAPKAVKPKRKSLYSKAKDKLHGYFYRPKR